MKKRVLFIIILFSFIFCSCKTGNKTFTVTFHEQIENGNVIEKKYNENMIYDEPKIFTRTNFEFDGWYFDKSLSKKVNFPYEIKDDVDLYSKWLKICKITFIDNDNIIQQTSVKEGQIISNYEISNDNFIGWSTDKDNYVPFDFNNIINGDLSLYAFYKEDNTYVVKFNDNDSLLDSKVVNENGTISPITSPTKDGYTFIGWSTNKDNYNSFNFNTNINDNLSLYAFYEKIITYVVKFYDNDSLLDSKVVNENGTISPITSPTKDGYTFIGWSTNKDNYNSFNFNTNINDNLSLYAFYEKIITYVVKFYDNDSLLDSKVVNENGTISPITSPTKDGYTFIGWSTNKDNYNSFNFNTNINDNLSLYAFYEKIITYVVTFNVDGTKTQQNVINGNKVIEPETPYKNGYTFLGWYLDDSLFNFNTIIEENIELIARFSESQISLSSYGGYEEGLYFEADINNNNPSDYTVSYKLSSSNNWLDVDEELIRIENNKIRCDVIGLTKGNYDVKITLNNKSSIIKCSVSNTDRSGYAHFNYSSGIGAYKDDGSIKNDAIIVYVTNENKNNVSIKINNKTYTGLVNIIQNQTKIGKPLDIRIIGKITTNQYNVKSNEPRLTNNSNLSSNFFVNTLETKYGDNLVGLTVQYMDKKEEKSYKFLTTETGLKENGTGKSSFKETTYKGSEYKNLYGLKVYDDDSYFNMLDVTGQSNITIQGIGTTAELFQWGFTWKDCNSIEIKNLTFTDYTEDACSFEGSNVKSYGNYWIHNNTFNRGKNNWDVSGERDKYAGDGGCDLKQVHNVTLSYNKFNNCKKTGLVGGNDSNLTMNITFHHNYYYKVESRLPLGRQANMHIYNNYYDNCGTCQDIRANAFVLSEKNYFYKCSYPQKITTTDAYKNTIIKSVDDKYESCNNKSQATISSRTDTLQGECKPDGSTNYTNFDMNENLFYYDKTNKKSNVTNLLETNDVKSYCQKYSGILSNNKTNDYKDDNTSTTPTPDIPNSSTDWVNKINEDFSINKTITKLTQNSVNQAGIYYYTDSLDNNNYLKIENNALTIFDKSDKTTYGYYMFDEIKNTTGKLKISIDFIPQTSNGKWSPIAFIGSEKNIYIRTDENKYLGYSFDNTTVTKIDSSILKANSVYTITLLIDYDNNVATIKINDLEVIIADYSCIYKITGIRFMTSEKNERTFTVDNIKVDWY